MMLGEILLKEPKKMRPNLCITLVGGLLHDERDQGDCCSF